MPPPPLHPRSLSTSTLFTTIALLSFLIVGAPHVLPCPAGVNRLDQRRAKSNGAGGGGGGGVKEGKEGERKRKCPGLVGAVLGRREERESGEEEEDSGGGIGAAARGRRRTVVLEGRRKEVKGAGK